MPRHPDDPFENVQREVERLFHDLVYQRHPACHFTDTGWVPPADLVLAKGGARVLIELAGVPRQNVHVRIVGRMLEISGRRNPPQDPGEALYHRAEIYFGDFRRVVELPWDADADHIAARYHDGMLEIQVRPAPKPADTEVPIEEQRP